ncbi:MAG: PEP-CTERM sorting domain-containing protein [Planctomycetota bacterium]
MSVLEVEVNHRVTYWNVPRACEISCQDAWVRCLSFSLVLPQKGKLLMSYKHSMNVGLALLVIGLLLAGSASASPITVLNPSFQSPVRTDGKDGGATNWTKVAGTVGVWNPEGTYFTGAAGDAGIPSGADGTQILYLLGAGAHSYQVLADTLLPGTYTLTVAAGRSLPGTLSTDTDSFIFSLSTDVLGGLFGGSPLMTYSGASTSLTEGAFVDRSLSFLVESDNIHIGELLRIDLASAAGWGFFDNVRLDHAPVPEPGTLVLLATGFIGLPACSWRKRKCRGSRT